ncbi:hypothetical protein H5183_18220 [Pseudoalteromonas sp. SR44-8]|uniref:hypothetical protein n=1 Tax=Pseudoalteromonas sp. SR44-8 TaxID=2760933 RepID=UPI001603D860|nr:hypothetical protein [Pseudoalteromonas sp. SR44-8]MBB1303277.1 hypothetical protein [Pseudoalteromonas sp. SR44-8]
MENTPYIKLFRRKTLIPRFIVLFSVLVVIFLASFLFFTVNSPESKAKNFLKKHENDLEHAILLAEQRDLQAVQWVDDKSGERFAHKLIRKKGSKEFVKVTDPSLDELTEFLLNKNIDVLWIQYFQGVWLIRKAFTFSYQDRQQEGYFVFGNPEKIGLCVLGYGAKDYGKYEHVTGNWYMAMCEYPRN